MRLIQRWALLILVSVGSALNVQTVQSSETFSYADLVGRLIDVEGLAVLPSKGETCAQWSSWDRSSQYDADSGKYIHWDANNDGPCLIRKEGQQGVMAEMEGPGCIFRVWSALAEQGHVKIYLDGNDEPAVDLPFVDFFRGEVAPFKYPSLSYNLVDQDCRGQNLYIPIPYQKSCKIVADEGWGRYYQFVYVTFPAGTEVPTFSTEMARENAGVLQKVNDYLEQSMGTDPAGKRSGQRTERGAVSVTPGAAASLTLQGARAITGIRGKVRCSDRDDQMRALRKVVLKISFDGEQQPQVWCPLGDFFGTAPGENPYKSLVTGMTEDSYYAYWYMPFASGARVELINEDDVTREVDYEIVHVPLLRPFDQLAHFHCKWHRTVHELPVDRWPDWVMLRTEGRGRFCGVMLHVWNPRGGWWGEGDEKFFVDGERYPSTFGTGSEDYFGYAWCHPGLFQRAFHCQTMTQNNKGHQSVLRWHVADNVPFQSSFEGCIEKYYRLEERGTKYACTVAWYLAPGGADPYQPTPVEQRHNYYDSPPLAGGGFKVLGEPRGNIATQSMAHYPGGKWHNDDHLWWTGAKPGDKLDAVVPAPKSGVFHVRVRLTKARDYGIVQLYINGNRAGKPIDLYAPDVVPTDLISIGEHELAEGANTLCAEIVGANKRAIKSYMFGLDSVILEEPK